MCRFMTRARLSIVLCAAALAAVAAGCGDDNSNSTSSTAATTDTQTQTQTQTGTTTIPRDDRPTAPPKAKRVTPTAGEADLSKKPKVPKGKGSPPSKLEIEDLIVGKGRRAKQGDDVSVQYVGVLFENG